MPSTDTRLGFLLGAGLGLAFGAWRQARSRGSLPQISQAVPPQVSETGQLTQEIQDLRQQLQWQYKGILAEQEEHYRQLESLIALYSQIDFRAPLPGMRRWAISPDFANLIVSQIKARQPNLILELGSGVSTLLAGYCLQQNGLGRVIAVDHEREFAELTNARIAQHGLSDVAEAVYAPLQEVNIGGKMWLWYDISVFSKLFDIDLLVIDGPPQYNSPNSMVRFPALPVLYSALATNALILLDDADRPDEQQIVRMWLEGYGVTQIAHFDTERGAALLQRE